MMAGVHRSGGWGWQRSRSGKRYSRKVGGGRRKRRSWKRWTMSLVYNEFELRRYCSTLDTARIQCMSIFPILPQFTNIGLLPLWPVAACSPTEASSRANSIEEIRSEHSSVKNSEELLRIFAAGELILHKEMITCFARPFLSISRYSMSATKNVEASRYALNAMFALKLYISL